MTKTIKVVVSDRIRLSRKVIKPNVIDDRYNIALYDERACEKCENLPDRHNDLCEDCPAFTGRYRFYSKNEAEKGVWSLPQADELWVEDYVYNVADRHGYDVQWVDQRKKVPFENPIKFTGKLYGKGDTFADGTPRANQERIVAKWLAKETGAIRARPRTGKTVIATYLYCAMGQKTLILAHQKDLLKQFYETATGLGPPKFRGNKRIADGVPAQNRKAVTNIGRIQEKTGREVIRVIENFGQLKRATEYYDIILMTYQSFLHDHERILRYINGRYSMLVVDEQHQGSADGYLRVLATMDMRHRLSLSATIERKDSRDRFGQMVLGPVVASSNVSALIPKITFHETGFTCKLKTWAGVTRRRDSDKERNKKIVRQVFKDIADGHKVIIIPVRSRKIQERLVRVLNKSAKQLFEKRGEDWPIELAKAFWRGSKRDEVLAWVDSFEWDCKPPSGVDPKHRGDPPRVIVAIEKMIKQAIDFARPTMLYVWEPMSGKRGVGAPMFDQMANRVCTPMVGKRQPHVRIWLDNVTMYRSALTGLFWHEIYPKSNIKHREDVKNVKYHIDPNHYVHIKAMLSKKDDSPRNDTSWAKWAVVR